MGVRQAWGKERKNSFILSCERSSAAMFNEPAMYEAVILKLRFTSTKNSALIERMRLKSLAEWEMIANATAALSE